MDPSSISSEQAEKLEYVGRQHCATSERQRLFPVELSCRLTVSSRSDALRRAQSSESVRPPTGWIPPVNPDASLKELKAIAHTIRTENYNDIGRMLVPYLHKLTPEQWHQYLVWTWQKMLGRMELRLYTACHELHRICTTSGK